MVSIFAMRRSSLSLPLAALCGEKKGGFFWTGSSGVFLSVGNLLRSQSREGPQKFHAPTSHGRGKKPRPRLGTDLPEPMDLVGGPRLVLSQPRSLPCLFVQQVCSTMAQPDLTLERLRDEPKKSQKNGFLLELRVGAAKVGDRVLASSGAEFWLVLCCLFPSCPWEPKGLQWDCLSLCPVSPGPWCGQPRTFNC